MARVRRIEQTPVTHGNVVYTYYYAHGGAYINNNQRIMRILHRFRKSLVAIICFVFLGLWLLSYLAPLYDSEHNFLYDDTNLDAMVDVCARSSVDGTYAKKGTLPSTLDITVELFGEMKYLDLAEYNAYTKKISFESIKYQAVPVKFQFDMQLVGVSPNVLSLGGSYLQCETSTLNLIVKLDAESSFSFGFLGNRPKRGILRLKKVCFHLPGPMKLNINHRSLPLIPIIMSSKLLNRVI